MRFYITLSNINVSKNYNSNINLGKWKNT